MALRRCHRHKPRNANVIYASETVSFVKRNNHLSPSCPRAPIDKAILVQQYLISSAVQPRVPAGSRGPETTHLRAEQHLATRRDFYPRVSAGLEKKEKFATLAYAERNTRQLAYTSRGWAPENGVIPPDAESEGGNREGLRASRAV